MPSSIESILEWSSALLATTPAHWKSLCRIIPIELLTRKPAPGEWSALECLQHLLDSEGIYAARVQFFLQGEDFPGFNPEEEGTPLDPHPNPPEMTARFAEMRKESLRFNSALTPADLQRRARHSEHGVVSLAEMLHQWAAHDLNHTMQAERALIQPFISGSGPWKDDYKDFVLSGDRPSGF